jgi:hypothetical protein
MKCFCGFALTEVRGNVRGSVPFCVHDLPGWQDLAGAEEALMKKYREYPIYMNYPEGWEAERLRQRENFVDKGDYQMMEWLDDTGKGLYATMADDNPSPVSQRYDQQILDALTLISSNQLGSFLLDSLDTSETYWILPLDYIERRTCDCAAYTFPGKPKERGGIRIYFSPTDFNRGVAKRYSADDVLFHELVHAYRDAELGYSRTNSKHLNKAMLPDYDNMEEFLALQLQNVYLAFRRDTAFYHSYRRPHSISKTDAYKAFENDARILGVFRYFLDNEPIISQMTNLTLPDDAYNPWRDLDDLEKTYLKKHPGKRLIKF